MRRLLIHGTLLAAALFLAQGCMKQYVIAYGDHNSTAVVVAGQDKPVDIRGRLNGTLPNGM